MKIVRIPFRASVLAAAMTLFLNADAVNVTVTGMGKDHFFGWGYYIEYTIDGHAYRSDTAGEAINSIAWNHMSEEDRKKTIDAYGAQSGRRLEDFGNETAQKMADRVNSEQGWTDAWAKYKEALVYRDFPTHAAIFDDESARDAYFQENFLPHWPEGTEVFWDGEMEQLKEEQTLVWKWACESYNAIKKANEKRQQTNVQALSGDLIALICDKVLVPNITAANPIELGFQYGIRKEVLGSLLDYANSITGFGDSLVEEVAGKRVTGESGAQLVAKLTDMINMDLHMINLCFERLKSNRAEIESRGVANAAQRAKEEDEYQAKIKAEQAAVAAARAATPTDGQPLDEGIVQTGNEYNRQIENLRKACDDETDEDRKAALEAQIQRKVEEAEAYRARIHAEVDARFAAWATACENAMDAWAKKNPRAQGNYPSDTPGKDVLDAFRRVSLFRDCDESTLASAAAYVTDYRNWLNGLESEYPGWIEAGNSMVLEYRAAYQEIATDANAVPDGFHGNSRKEVLAKLDNQVGSALVFRGEENELASLEATLDSYRAARDNYHQLQEETAARKSELYDNVELAVQAYNEAHGKMAAAVKQLPDFLDGVTTDDMLILKAPESSKLYRTIFEGTPKGNAAMLRTYCATVNELYSEYLVQKCRKELAEKYINSYMNEWRAGRYGSGTPEYSWLYLTQEETDNARLLKAAVRDFNQQDRDGKLMKCYVILKDNEAYYAGQRSNRRSLASIAGGGDAAVSSTSAEELPTYWELCEDIENARNSANNFADSVEGYSRVDADLLAPLMASVQESRDVFTWEYAIEGGCAKITGYGGVAVGEVVVPSSLEGCPVVEIGDRALAESGRMTSVTIPENVEKIGVGVFSGCPALMEIKVAEGNAAYRVVNRLLFPKGSLEPIAGVGGEVVLPPGVAKIGTDVFYGFSSLTAIAIPASVTEIESYAFYGCDNLKTVYVDRNDAERVRELMKASGLDTYGVTFVSERTETIDGIEWQYSLSMGRAVVTSIPEQKEGVSLGKVVVPSTLGGCPVTEIGDSVFVWRNDIDEVVIPEGVTKIGEYAFSTSPSIKAVSIPSSVWEIDATAFTYSSITKVSVVKGDAARVKKLLAAAGFKGSAKFEETLPKPAPVKPGPGEIDPPAPGSVEPVVVNEPYAAEKAVTLTGCIYEGDRVAGLVELKLGKVNAKKGSGKINASVTDLNGRKFAAKALTVEGIDGMNPVNAVFEVKTLGRLEVRIGGTKFVGTLNGVLVQSSAVGGEVTGTPKFSFLAEAPEIVQGVAVESLFLPEGETVGMSGKKWTLAKAATVAYKKDKATGEFGWVVNNGKDDPNKTNLSGLKLTYAAKKGTFKGSFKAYGLDTRGKTPKLKKFTVKVAGVFANGVGYGVATEKKTGSWAVEIR